MKRRIEKLALNRETLRLLTDGETAQVAGGTFDSRDTKVCCKISISHCSACCP